MTMVFMKLGNFSLSRKGENSGAITGSSLELEPATGMRLSAGQGG